MLRGDRRGGLPQKMELVKREWADCPPPAGGEEGRGRSFKVMQWNSLADGEYQATKLSVCGYVGDGKKEKRYE